MGRDETEWVEIVSNCLAKLNEVEVVVHSSADRAPAELCKNEVLFVESSSGNVFRALVEPVPKDILNEENKYDARPIDAKNLADDDLLPEIVNIWGHGEKGSVETGEGLHGWLTDHGHLEQIEEIVAEYRRRKRLPSRAWVKLADFRPNGFAYYVDTLGRIAVADDTGTFPHESSFGVRYLNFDFGLQAVRLTVPLKSGYHDKPCSIFVGSQNEVGFVQELWEKASRGEI